MTQDQLLKNCLLMGHTKYTIAMGVQNSQNCLGQVAFDDAAPRAVVLM